MRTIKTFLGIQAWEDATHVQVLQIIRLAEKDCWMPTDTAQRIVDFLAQQITENN